MVIDKIQNSRLYTSLNSNLAFAFDYIHNTNLNLLENGKYPIKGDDVFAIVMEYNTKSSSACKLEAHKKYIDVQYVIDGVELINITTLKNQIPSSPYNEEKDVVFYSEPDSLPIKLEAGMFAIFFPNDIHAPGIKYNASRKVKKVVVKVIV